MAPQALVDIHPTAVVDSHAQLGEGVKVGPYAVIEGAGCIKESTVLSSEDAKTFVSGGQMMRIRTHTNPFNYYHRMEPVDWESVFSDYKGELSLEMGFGRGIFLRHYAAKYPNKNIVGVEVRKTIVEILKKRIDKEGIKNSYLVHGNGLIFLEDAIKDNTLKEIFVFHPDPWLKKRHYRRRIINKAFLNAAFKKLIPGGHIYVATDVESLWADIKNQFEEHGKFIVDQNSTFWDQDYFTHWQSFSEVDKRSQFRCAWKKE